MDDSLPPRILSILAATKAWRVSETAGQLILGGRDSIWLELGEAVQQAPPNAGLYALGIQQGVSYDKGRTRIVYLGSTSNLKRRLGAHAGQSHSDLVNELRTTFPGVLQAMWAELPGLSDKWLRGTEAEALGAFERAFEALPICNMEMPQSDVAAYCEGLVVIATDDDLLSPMTLDFLAERLGSVCVRQLKKLANVLVFSLDANGNLRSGQEFKVASFVKKEVLDAERCREIEHLSTIWDEHVACWPLEKMVGILNVCDALTPAKGAVASKVRRFQAPRRGKPTPHTWGEVALVMGRRIAGTWFPEEKVWVKIVFGKQLLGQAMMEHWGFRGEDKSDLPQAQEPRKSYWEEHAEEIEEDETHVVKSLENDYVETCVVHVDEDGIVTRETTITRSPEPLKRELEEQDRSERVLTGGMLAAIESLYRRALESLAAM